PPAAFRQISRPAEAIGWWQVAICFVIAAYYAVIIAWAVRYIGYSFGEQWGEDANAFFFGDFLQAADAPGFVSDYVGGVLWPLIAVWAVVLVILRSASATASRRPTSSSSRCWWSSSSSWWAARSRSTVPARGSPVCSGRTGRRSAPAACGSPPTGRSSSRSPSASAS